MDAFQKVVFNQAHANISEMINNVVLPTSTLEQERRLLNRQTSAVILELLR